MLERDLDGMYCIDYFGKAQEELDDPFYDFTDYIQKSVDKIRQGMNASKHPSKADVKILVYPNLIIKVLNFDK